MNEKFYKARDAIENGTYLKASIWMLRRYRAELKRPQLWESDPKAAYAVLTKAGWVAKVDKEIENRKERRRAFVRSVAKGVLIGVIVGVILLLLSYFLSNHNKSNKTPPSKPPKPQESNQAPIRTLPSPKTGLKADTKPPQQVAPSDRR